MKTFNTIGICGIGNMGAAAVVAFQRAGYDVLIWARDARKFDQLPARLNAFHKILDDFQPTPSVRGQVRVCPDLNDLDEQADVILECISERLDVKAELLQRFPGARARQALFLSATSGLSITEMGRRSGLEPLLVGAHFWNPPHLMPLVEMVRGEQTPDALFDRACDLIASLGKTVVKVSKDVPGFIGNRLQHALWREAMRLVQDGVASADDVDLVARYTFALRLPAVGPLENMDLIGLDLVRDIQDYLLGDLAADRRAPDVLRSLVDSGKLGAKTGQGFFDWSRRQADQVLQRRDQHILFELAALAQAAGNPTAPG